MCSVAVVVGGRCSKAWISLLCFSRSDKFAVLIQNGQKNCHNIKSFKCEFRKSSDTNVDEIS